MGLPSSPEHPQPLRVVAHAVRGYIDKLGPIWVEAQLIEINQGTRSRLVFLTMRDTLAEVSVSVSISPLTFDAAGPLTKGQTVIARLKPSYYETSGRLTFVCDSITPSGEGRLLARLDNPAKHWKYNTGDLKERAFWDDYMAAYQAVFDATNTEHAPWYVVPANKKWNARIAVQQLLLEALMALKLEWPKAEFDVDAERRLAERS